MLVLSNLVSNVPAVLIASPLVDSAGGSATTEALRMRYRSKDGREWEVTLETPGKVLSVAPELERSGAQLPEHQVQIVFASGDERYAEEYTELAALEDLSGDDLEEWLTAVKRGKGV